MMDSYEEDQRRLRDMQEREVVTKERAVAIAEREQAIRDSDSAGYPERLRVQRHHEVLCLVLKELVVRHDVRDAQVAQGTVAQARLVADLAYPPPKQEPSE